MNYNFFHKLYDSEKEVTLPEKFNNPFRYKPDKLAIKASEQVREYLAAQSCFGEDIENGKMFGVLIVVAPNGEVGYLSAFSGLLAGQNNHPFFVPPVYDLLSDEGYFKYEESNISEINRKIIEQTNSPRLIQLKKQLLDKKEALASQISDFKATIKQNKELRNKKRSDCNLSQTEKDILIKESQFDKAELKRLMVWAKSEIDLIEAMISPLTREIESLKDERKERSAKLQQWLFKQFVLHNAEGESSNLIDIFHSFSNSLPPAGAGECAAPKLLQYAYLNNLKPISMAEFWIGNSPKGELRRDGCFYPSCKGKCLPILTYMLKGLDVEDAEFYMNNKLSDIKVIYEDDYILAVDKPCGILSVPGKIEGKSVQDWVREEYLKNNEAYVVHRLDMATSGVLLIAKSMKVYKQMQLLFASRAVDKLYIAVVEGVARNKEGEINLPLMPDYNNRPAQKVDYDFGKDAVTKYRVLSVQKKGKQYFTRMSLVPLTGRTHQLRVHLAHTESLGLPIVGDEIYGTPNSRLMLHATCLSFVHPVTRVKIKIESEPPF